MEKESTVYFISYFLPVTSHHLEFCTFLSTWNHVGKKLPKYMYFISYSPMPITSPAVILNSPKNSFYPPNTVLVLTSYEYKNSLFLFPPSTPPFLLFLSWWFLLEIVPWCHFYFVLTLFWLKKTLVSVKNLILCASFIWRPLHFFGKSFTFIPFFPHGLTISLMFDETYFLCCIL